MSHRNETGSQEKLWKLTYEDDDDVELYGVTGRNLDSGQDSGWISSEDNNNCNNNNNQIRLENCGKPTHKEPGDPCGNPMKRRNGGGYGNDGNGGNGSAHIREKVQKKMQRIKIYERKMMQRLNNDDDDDDEYENQTTVVTTYELPENTTNEQHQQQQRQSSGEENESSDIDAHESGENQDDCPGGKLNRVTRLIIRRDSDLELLVNRVNNLDSFRRCCYGRPGVCSWLPGVRCFDWLESTNVERWMSRWPRCLKVTFVLGVSLIIMLIYAIIVTAGVKAILAD